MSNTVAAAIGIVTAVVTGAAGWLVSKMRFSGRINTTEATTLWAESQAMRHELRDQLAAVTIERDNESKRADAEAKGRQECEAENLALRRQLLGQGLRQGEGKHDG